MDGRMGDPPPAHGGKRLVCRSTRITRCHTTSRHRYQSFPGKSSAVRVARRTFHVERFSERYRCGGEASLDIGLTAIAVATGLAKSFSGHERPELDPCALKYFSRWRGRAASGLWNGCDRLEHAEAWRNCRRGGGGERRRGADLQ